MGQLTLLMVVRVAPGGRFIGPTFSTFFLSLSTTLASAQISPRSSCDVLYTYDRRALSHNGIKRGNVGPSKHGIWGECDETFCVESVSCVGVALNLPHGVSQDARPRPVYWLSKSVTEVLSLYPT
ncbi:hypothetical protein EDB92DRAFT_1886621 [Lactarius akahatsu]|uniref:Uncharacterized protein n=1 Tax=Lactarius akahatsu TaxID=416441 RepID=A0AAD4L8K4_9AGAM|nr:hypothetical protein EDB92DRAFT_1886621 [Lactarius akahatsu]